MPGSRSTAAPPCASSCASRRRRAKEKAEAKKEAAAEAKADAEKADDVEIPDFKDKPLDEYEADLEKLKLKPDIQLRISTTDAGTVLGVSPAVGEKAEEGDVVTVNASGGPAPVAVQESPVVHVVNPVGGKELYRLPQPQGSAMEPSYLPGGSQVVYRSGSRIILADDGKDADYRTVYAGGDTLVRPTVASDGNTLAMIRREEGDGDLCFGRLDLADLGRLCLPDDGWNLDGRISWRPDGKAVLVQARRRGNPSVFAVRQYRTKTAFTIDPLKWTRPHGDADRQAGQGRAARRLLAHGRRIARDHEPRHRPLRARVRGLHGPAPRPADLDGDAGVRRRVAAGRARGDGRAEGRRLHAGPRQAHPLPARDAEGHVAGG